MEIIVNNIKYDLRPEGAFVVFNNYRGDITIPAQILVDGQAIPVIGIAVDAFYGCDDVTSVTLPEGLTTIEDSAFESMNGLIEIVIPDSVTHIGKVAFSDCQSLQRVVLPAQLQTISEDLFESCGSLTEVNIPAGVKTLEAGCFAACTSLKKIQLPKGLETIGGLAFELCSQLERVIIPNGVTKIGGRAFNLCSNLDIISIPNSVTFVGTDAFEGTKWLESYSIAHVLAGKVLYKYKPIKEYGSEPNCIIIDDVERIADNAFDMIDRPMRIFLPKNLKEMDIAAIMPEEYANEGYYTFVLPEGVGEDYPYHDTWCHCATIDGLYYMLDDKEMTAMVVRSFDYLYRGCFVIPERVTYAGKDYEVKAIGYRAFAMDPNYVDYMDEHDKIDALLQGASHVEIPATVKRIEDEAFYYCHGLTTVVLHGEVDYIGERAFDIPNNDLQAIIVPADLKRSYQTGELERYQHLVTDCVAQLDGLYYSLDADTHTAKVIHSTNDLYCNYYTGDIVIPAQITYEGQGYQVTEIAGAAFSSCSIDSITLPEGLVVIGEQAFYGSDLRYVDVPDTVESIGHGAFVDCSELRYVKLSENVRLMRNHLFSGCTQLQTVLLGSKIKNVGGSAFYDCENLRSIYLPETVKKIGAEAFYGCGSLKEVRVPDSVHILDMTAFESCYELHTIILGPNISSVKGVQELADVCEATIYVPRHKVEAYCQAGLEPLRDYIEPIESMEAESMETLLDWFVEHQLNAEE